MKVAPNSVSGRVVKTRRTSPPGWWSSGAIAKSISAPSDRPIQLVCMCRIGSGQSRPVKSSSSSAYGGRAQVPLVQVALLDQRAAAPAVPIGALDLLARERPVVRAPVDRRLHAIGQALLQEAQEQPLVPAVELRVGRDDLGVPGERRAHRPELAAHLLDVRHRPGERVAAVLDGGVLGRQAEGIEADREEHVVAVHPAVARQRVGRGDDVPVADVQVARRIRVHREQVVLGLRLVAKVRVVQAVGRPLRLPAWPRWRTDRSARSGFGPRRCRSRWPSDTTHPPPAGEGWMVGCARVDGGATGTRTPDPLHAMQVLFQLSYSPTERAFYQRGPVTPR